MLNYVLIAIILGMLVKNFILPRLNLEIIFDAGIEFSAKIFLMAGIILIGARMNLGDVVAVGSNAIMMVIGSIVLSLAVCGWVGKKSFGERAGHLIGIGIGIGVCGISAIIALAPVIKAKEKEVFFAIAAVLLADFMILIGLLLVDRLANLGNEFVGYFAGVVPANTAQAIAILVMTYIYTVRGLPVGETVRVNLLWTKFPKFILGFLVASLLATLDVFPANSSVIFQNLSQWFFTICFVGLGSGIDFSSFNKKEASPILLGLGMTLILAIYAFLWIRFIIGAG